MKLILIDGAIINLLFIKYKLFIIDDNTTSAFFCQEPIYLLSRGHPGCRKVFFREGMTRKGIGAWLCFLRSFGMIDCDELGRLLALIQLHPTSSDLHTPNRVPHLPPPSDK